LINKQTYPGCTMALDCNRSILA